MKLWPVLLICLLLVLIIGGYSYNQYALLNQIDAKLEKVGLGTVSLSGAKLDMNLAITNPSAITLQIDKLMLDFYASGLDVGRVESEPFTLTAGETTRISFPLEVSFSKLGMSAIDAFRKGNLNWTVDGQADLTLPFGLDYTHKFTIPQ
ncbi:LEA type 2 family protein [Candidatus Woesearchaeota archaeon]|nr:LEA type 2 family protein [Candidatus Woesearchaeota archaeon]